MKTSWRTWFGILSSWLVLTNVDAATFTWTGLAGTTNVSTPGNWLGGNVPTGSSTDDVAFGDSSISNPLFPNTFTLRDISLTALNTGYFLDGSGSNPTLTLLGNVRSTAGSGYFLVFSQIGVNLAAGSHTFDVQGGDIYFFGKLNGSGTIVKTGARSLNVASGDDTNSAFTGNITLTQGTLSVAGDRALGTGTITMNGGTLAVSNLYEDDHTVLLGNNLAFNSNVLLGEIGLDVYNQKFSNTLMIQGTATSASSASVTIADHNLVIFDGNLSATSLTFSGLGSAYFSGSSNAISGTLTVNSGVVAFMNANPTGGALISTGNGYIGTGSPAAQNFLNSFNKSSTTGIVGFDSPDLSAPNTFNGLLNLSGFSNAMRLGTSTVAIIAGNITPQSNTYQFGGRGDLTVQSDLTGSRAVTVDNGLLLRLTGANTYSNGTTATSGAILFSDSRSIPSSGQLSAGSNGYIGNTENAQISESAFLAKFNPSSTVGVIGFDADDVNFGRTISNNLNLNGFDSNVFLGTATKLTLASSITLTPAGSTYNFTGFRSGQLTVNSVLSGSRGVVIGLAAGNIDSIGAFGTTLSPTVTLAGNNTYTGGTTLQSGMLILGRANALGTGALTVADFGEQRTGLHTSSTITISNAIDFGSANDFLLGGSSDFTLSGNLTGAFGSVNKVDFDSVTLSGSNAGMSSLLQLRTATLTFASNTAAGSGDLELYQYNGEGPTTTAAFTSSAPVMGSLSGDPSTQVSLNMGSGHSLTINQSSDKKYEGVITGNGGLTKTGSATLELSGSSNYTGTTAVNAGVLKASSNSAFGSGSLLLNGGTINVASGSTISNALIVGGSGGTLTGSGAFGSAVAVATNTIVSPGDGVGMLTFGGGLTFGQQGIYNFEIKSATGTAGSGYDSVSVTGALAFTSTMGSPFHLNLTSLNGSGTMGALTDFNSSTAYTWMIASATGGISGFNAAAINIDASQFSNSLGSGYFSVSTAGNSLFLNFVAVPEPSTWAMLLSGVGAVGWITRRRRRS